jgi:CubicO group peptidase (beta-lactamase class C family)
MLHKILTACMALLCIAGRGNEPSFEKNIDWLSFRDLTGESFGEKFQQYKNAGYIMIDMDGYEASGGIRYSMVWEKNKTNRGWAEYRDMTDDGYHTKWTEMKNQGYRPVDIESYRMGGGQRFAGIWIKNTESYNWASKRGMTKAEFESYKTEQKNAGLKMIDLEMYETSSGIRYASIWVKNYDNTDWKQEHALDRDGYQERINTLSSQGYLITNFDSYKDGGTQRYAFICEKKSGLGYQVRTDRTELEYANMWREYRDKGYRLIDFECYSTSSGMRYGGIWIENNSRFDYNKKEELDNLITKYRNDNNLPGISVAIIKDGDILYRRGFGFADKEGGKVAHGETVYMAASVSKVFGGTLAVKLADEGKLRNGTNVSLNLNNTTRSYLTNVQKSDGSLVTLPAKHIHTVKQLYAHLGCLQHYDGPEPATQQYNKAIDALTQIWNAGFVAGCTNNTNANYSTHAHTYLAAVLEKVTGRTSAQLVQSELAAPYDLESLRVMYTTSNLPSDYERAKPYEDDNSATSYGNNSWKVFGGGLEMSALDLARFGWKVLDGKIVKPAARDNVLWTRVLSGEGYGVAWAVGGSSPNRIAEHGGSWTGARSHLRVYRDKGVVIAIMSNRRGHTVGDVDVLCNNIANIVL